MDLDFWDCFGRLFKIFKMDLDFWDCFGRTCNMDLDFWDCLGIEKSVSKAM